MTVVEGEPDHTGLGELARALRRLFRRWERAHPNRDSGGLTREQQTTATRSPGSDEDSGAEQ
jgi:hypothetical protein